MTFEQLFYCSLFVNFILIASLVWLVVNNEVNKQIAKSIKALEEALEQHKKEALKQLGDYNE